MPKRTNTYCKTLATLEAMKMENILKAERCGAVKKHVMMPSQNLAVDELIMALEGVKSPSTIAAWVPPSVGYADISPSRGEISRWRFARLTNSTSAIWQKASLTPISPLEGEMSGRTEGGTATTEANQIGAQSMWRREKTG